LFLEDGQGGHNVGFWLIYFTLSKKFVTFMTLELNFEKNTIKVHHVRDGRDDGHDENLHGREHGYALPLRRVQ